MINEYSHIDLDFKSFIFKENRAFLGKEISEILTSLQEIQDEAKKIGTKNLVRFTDKIVNQIRSLLGGHWLDDDLKFLKGMQKVGVALAKALSDNDNLEDTIASSVVEIQNILKKMNVPVNDLGVQRQDAANKPEIPPSNIMPPTAPETGPEGMSGFSVNPPAKPTAPIGAPPLQ